MTPDELRLECLKLVQQTANASGMLLTSSEIISRARAYADFVIDPGGHGSVVKANGAQNPELAAEARLRMPASPASQFHPPPLAGRPLQSRPAHRIMKK
jgi:hypothetical protein